MRDLMRRLEQLEQNVAASACVCASRPVARQTYHDGVRTDTNPEPEPVTCPIHGPMQPFVIIREFVSPRHCEATDA